jgi:putative transposase
MLAGDSFTVDTMFLRRIYVLFFIESPAAGSTSPASPQPERRMGDPTSRNLLMDLDERADRLRFIRDRDTKFTAGVVLTEYTRHNNRHRPHRSLRTPSRTSPSLDRLPTGADHPRKILGGLINEYDRRAPAQL